MAKRTWGGIFCDLTDRVEDLKKAHVLMRSGRRRREARHLTDLARLPTTEERLEAENGPSPRQLLGLFRKASKVYKERGHCARCTNKGFSRALG